MVFVEAKILQHLIAGRRKYAASWRAAKAIMSIPEAEEDDGQFTEDGDLENGGANLTEDLVEKIVSKIQFPQFFKSRVLSRQWHSKFSLTSQLGDIPLHSPFLHEVRSAASNQWPTYCPAFVSSVPESGALLIGFDRVTETWQKFRIHPSIPFPLEHYVWERALGGSIMLFNDPSQREFQLIVANVLTGSWRTLPPCPQPTKDPMLLVIPGCSDGYKILVYELVNTNEEEDYPDCRIQLYDSNTRRWSGRSSPLNFQTLSTHSAYVDGNLYNMWPRQKEYMSVLRCNLDSGVWTEITHPLDHKKEKFLNGGVFHCESVVLVITVFKALIPGRHRDHSPTKSFKDIRARVYELDLNSLKLTKVSESPPGMILHEIFTTFASASDCIYFCGVYEDDGKLSLSSYSVNTQTWCTHPSPPKEYLKLLNWKDFSCFQPGLNPFALA